MLLGAFGKTAVEIRELIVDYSNLASGGSASLQSVTATDSRGTDVTSTVIVAGSISTSGNAVTFLVGATNAAPTLLPPFRISIKITDSSSELLEGTVIVGINQN